MFEPEELMARIVDIEEQLKVSEMAPPAAEQLIACLEGEIAKRDARIVELEEERKEYSDIMERHGKLQMTAGAIAEERNQLRAELAALKAQEPVAELLRGQSAIGTWFDLNVFDQTVPNGTKLYAAPVSEAKAQDTVGEVVGWYRLDRPYEMTSYPSVCATWHKLGAPVAPLYAAPVSEAKAQGVVMPERWNVPRQMWKDARQPYGSPLNHADIEAAEKFNLALDEVARLNAAPVQQVSVPDGWRIERRELDGSVCFIIGSPRLLGVRANTSVWESDSDPAHLLLWHMLYAAPAAPAADASDVLDQAMYTLISIGYHENSGLVHELRQALAAHRAKGVVV